MKKRFIVKMDQRVESKAQKDFCLVLQERYKQTNNWLRKQITTNATISQNEIINKKGMAILQPKR